MFVAVGGLQSGERKSHRDKRDRKSVGVWLDTWNKVFESLQHCSRTKPDRGAVSRLKTRNKNRLPTKILNSRPCRKPERWRFLTVSVFNSQWSFSLNLFSFSRVCSFSHQVLKMMGGWKGCPIINGMDLCMGKKNVNSYINTQKYFSSYVHIIYQETSTPAEDIKQPHLCYVLHFVFYFTFCSSRFATTSAEMW